MAVKASQTLTFAANAVDAETVTVGGVVYTWESGTLDVANEVFVGATAAASAQNLFDAINRTGTPGVQYGSATVANPQVRAIAVTATTVVVQALVPGTVGNLIVSTEVMTQGSWGAGLLAGGTGSSADDLLVILNTMQMSAEVAQALRDYIFDPAAV